MERGRPGQRYIFSSGFVTVDLLMEWLEEITGQKRPRLRLSPPVMAGIAAVASPILSAIAPNMPQRLTPGAVHLLRMHRRADCAKAKRELGFQPTSVKDALRAAYEWFVAAGQIRGVTPRPAIRAEAENV
jgi:nucleoside-diphosphate-sugar epimerase